MTGKRSLKFHILKDNWALPRDIPSSAYPDGASTETETPKLDLYETEADIIAEIDLPGMKPEQIHIHVLENRLILEGRQEKYPEAGHFLRMERIQEDFRRIVLLPCAVDPRNGNARYENGVLVLKIPKITDRRRKAVKIQIQN